MSHFMILFRLRPKWYCTLSHLPITQNQVTTIPQLMLSIFSCCCELHLACNLTYCWDQYRYLFLSLINHSCGLGMDTLLSGPTLNFSKLRHACIKPINELKFYKQCIYKVQQYCSCLKMALSYSSCCHLFDRSQARQLTTLPHSMQSLDHRARRKKINVFYTVTNISHSR